MILQLIPPATPLWAVFADDKGAPSLKPITSLAILEVNGNRVISGVYPDEHLLAADWVEGFVSYATGDDPAPWVEKCQAKRKEIEKAKANPSKLYVPEQKKVVGGFN